MSKNGAHAVLISAHPLIWVKDQEQILILDEGSREIHALHGVEAVVWTWLTLGYPYPKILQILKVMLDLPFDQTEELLRVIFHNWQGAGLLDIEA